MNTFKTYFRIVRAKPLSFILPLVIFSLMIFLFNFASQRVDTDVLSINYAYKIEGEKPEGFDGLIAHLNRRGNVYEYQDDEELRMVVFDGMADFAFIVKDGRFTAMPHGVPEVRIAAVERVQEYWVYHDLYQDFSVPAVEEKLDALMEREVVIETPAVSGERSLVLMEQYFKFSAYVTIVGLFNVMIVVSTVLNEPSFRRRTLIGPTPYSRIQRGVLSGHLVIVAVVFCLVVAGSLLLHGPETVFSAAGSRMLLSYGVYILCIALMGFFLTRVIRSLQVGTMITNIVALGMSFISGAFVPSQWLSEPVKKVAQLFPMHWFIRSNEWAMQNSTDYPGGLWVMLLMSLVLFALIFVADYRSGRTAAGA